MKVKILVSVSSAIDGSHPGFDAGNEYEINEALGKSLIAAGIALEVKPAVKVQNKPTSTKKAVK